MKDKSKLTEHVALVTGGGRGIGRGIAIALAHEGAHVCVCSRTDAEIRSAVEEIQKLGGTASALVADVSSETDVQALAKITRRVIIVNVDILRWCSNNVYFA